MTHHVTSQPAAPEVTAATRTLAGPASSRPNRVAVIAVAIALLALSLGAWSLLGPRSPTPTVTPPLTAQQTADAKTRACTAASTVSTAVSLQTHADPGADPAATQAAAANARLSMTTGSTYLLARLDPATPPPLAARIRSFADALQDVVIHTLAGVSNDDPAQAARLQDAQTTSAQITDLCQ